MPEDAPVRFPAYRCANSYPTGLAARTLNAKIVAKRLESSGGVLHCSGDCPSVFLQNASPDEICVLNYRLARDAEQLFRRGAYKFEAQRAAVGVRPGLVGRSGQAFSQVEHFALGVTACAGLHEESQIPGDENGHANERRREESNLKI